MKRYLVFAGDTYYPSGGWDDFIGSFYDIESALICLRTKKAARGGWCHIVDLEKGEIVKTLDYDFVSKQMVEHP